MSDDKLLFTFILQRGVYLDKAPLSARAVKWQVWQRDGLLLAAADSQEEAIERAWKKLGRAVATQAGNEGADER